jgi:anti-sigma regulatory factor (Ser/Thr protein kinase)
MATRTDDDVLHTRLAGAPDLGAARVTLRRHLAAIGWCANAVDVAVLVASELATNGLQHAGPPVELDVEPHDSLLRISVRDASSAAPTMRDRGNEHGGYGLQLVARAAQAWGWHADSDGKVVWADIARGADRAP